MKQSKVSSPMSKVFVAKTTLDFRRWTLDYSSDLGLPFYAHNLLDLCDNFDQVFLVLHYRFD